MEKITDADVQEFIKKSGVENILVDLKKEISQRELSGNKFIVSDVYDKNNHQYVDLVQEGGGVWGIALLGYTYVLEKMGIRFFSLAGTSAGAINTILLAATKNKEEEKTEDVIRQFLELDMFSFVDGKKNDSRLTASIKNLIQKFILRKNYLGKLKKSILVFVAVLAFFSLATFIAGIFVPNIFIKWIAMAALLCWIIAAIILLLLNHRIKHIAQTGYGLNKGDAFHKWISGCLEKNNVKTLDDLKAKFSRVPDSLLVHRDKQRDENTVGNVSPPTNPMLTIISSDITTGNKIEFPRMWDLYWSEKSKVNPADFVRASMSIPVFFETYCIKGYK